MACSSNFVEVTPYEFDVPYIAKFPPTSGIDGFATILSQQDDGQVTLVCLSGLGDAWMLFTQLLNLPLDRGVGCDKE